MQALAERLEERVGGAALAAVQPIGFSGLKTFDPPPESLIGKTLAGTGRRGKYLILDFGGPRVFVHLSQAGRLDVEEPPKTTRGGKGGVVRLRFDNDVALLVREYGTERKAGWWVVGEGEVGPVEGLGPEPDVRRVRPVRPARGGPPPGAHAAPRPAHRRRHRPRPYR